MSSARLNVRAGEGRIGDAAGVQDNDDEDEDLRSAEKPGGQPKRGRGGDIGNTGGQQPSNGNADKGRASGVGAGGGSRDGPTPTTSTLTPRSGRSAGTLSGGRSSAPGSSGASDEDEGGARSRGGGTGGKRRRSAPTAGGAGASRGELEEMPAARVKRILANRQSAARSKERKLAYIGELESQVSALTTQLTNASVQLRALQQDTASLGDCNSALAQQALALREHIASRDADTARLAAELRQMQALLAAHNIPYSSAIPALSVAGGHGSAPFHNALPGSRPQPQDAASALQLAEQMLAEQQAAASRQTGGRPGGDGSRPPVSEAILPAEAPLLDGFQRLPMAADRGGPLLSPDLVQRAQLQALERHQAQQRLWAGSLASGSVGSADGPSSGATASLDASLLQQQFAAATAAGRPLGGSSSANFTRASLASLGGSFTPPPGLDLSGRQNHGTAGGDGGATANLQFFPNS